MASNLSSGEWRERSIRSELGVSTFPTNIPYERRSGYELQIKFPNNLIVYIMIEWCIIHKLPIHIWYIFSYIIYIYLYIILWKPHTCMVSSCLMDNSKFEVSSLFRHAWWSSLMMVDDGLGVPDSLQQPKVTDTYPWILSKWVEPNILLIWSYLNLKNPT